MPPLQSKQISSIFNMRHSVPCAVTNSWRLILLLLDRKVRTKCFVVKVVCTETSADNTLSFVGLFLVCWWWRVHRVVLARGRIIR